MRHKGALVASVVVSQNRMRFARNFRPGPSAAVGYYGPNT